MKNIFLILLVLFGLQTKAQMNFCDSVEVNVTTSTPYTVDLATNIPSLNLPGYVTYDWSACLLCTTCIGTDTTATPHFQVMMGDTVVVCLTTTLCINGLCYACNICDTLVYNPNLYQWEFMSSMGNPLVIKEIKNNSFLNNKIYDLLGRELSEIPTGTIYIKNREKFIR